MKCQYTYIHNNYQFYEYEALAGFLDRQAEKGYSLCGMFGRFANILKFKRSECPAGHSHVIFCRHQDSQIDTETEASRSEKICENIQFAVCRMSPDKLSADSVSAMEKQREMMSISVRKSWGLILSLLFIFVIGFLLKMSAVETSVVLSSPARTVLCLAPVLLFFLYLTGDLHDLKKGRAKEVSGRMYFTDRSGFKNRIFSFADFCVLFLFAAGAAVSLFLIFASKDPVVLLELLRIWFCGVVMAYIFRLKYRNSYIYLLFAAVSLVIFGI